MTVREAETGWAWFLVETPTRFKECPLPLAENERTRAHKAAYRELQRLALRWGVPIQINRRRKMTEA